MIINKLTKTMASSMLVLGLLTPLGLANTVSSLLGSSNVNDNLGVQATVNSGKVSTAVANQANASVLGNNVTSGLGVTTQLGL